MRIASPLASATARHWTVALAATAVYGLFAAAIIGHRTFSVPVLQLLSLATAAIATYAALVLPLTGAVIAAAIGVVWIGWAWLVSHLPGFGLEAAIVMALLGIAVWQRHRWDARLKSLRQITNDLDEERVIKSQAVESARQGYTALEKKLARYAKLQEIAEHLSNLTDLVAIGQLAVSRAFELIGKSDVCLLYLVDRERQELSLVASRKREGLRSIHAKHGDQFDRHVLRTHRPLLVNDIRRDFRFTVAVSPDRCTSSVIACPLMIAQSAEGVLRLDSGQPGAYGQDDLRFLDILLDLVATAVTNAKLFARTQQLAVTDGLTGLAMRRPFLEQLEREIARATRSREAVSVLLLDVDRFKTYNDTYGHTAGDRVLASVAEVLRATVPPDGLSARYGGEEFAVLLPRAAGVKAADVAEAVRQGIEARVAGRLRGNGEPVTVSIGVASCPTDAKAAMELIRLADERLYHAKHQGRNRVCTQ